MQQTQHVFDLHGPIRMNTLILKLASHLNKEQVEFFLGPPQYARVDGRAEAIESGGDVFEVPCTWLSLAPIIAAYIYSLRQDLPSSLCLGSLGQEF